MIRYVAPFCFGIIMASTAYADCRSAAMQCANEIASQSHCGSCSALWGEISQCAGARAGADPNHVLVCIRQVTAAAWQWPMYYDRVGAVCACLQR